MSQAGAVLECGCLVTTVPSSVALYGQEVRSLLGIVRSLLLSEKTLGHYGSLKVPLILGYLFLFPAT